MITVMKVWVLFDSSGYMKNILTNKDTANKLRSNDETVEEWFIEMIENMVYEEVDS
jgi:hypothetical protein